MTPTELNNALAEFEGYKWVKVADSVGELNSRALYGALSPDDTFLKEHGNPPMDWPILQVCYRPHYTGDLNAVHLVEMKLTVAQHCDFRNLLVVSVPEPERHVSATAIQRSIALAKTLGVWREP